MVHRNVFSLAPREFNLMSATVLKEAKEGDAVLDIGTLLMPAEYSVVFGHSECLAGAGAARCAPTLYFANMNKWNSGESYGFKSQACFGGGRQSRGCGREARDCLRGPIQRKQQRRDSTPTSTTCGATALLSSARGSISPGGLVSPICSPFAESVPTETPIRPGRSASCACGRTPRNY